jgi:hypothetical protein
VANHVDELRHNVEWVRLCDQGGASLPVEVVHAQSLLAQAQVEDYTLLFNYEIAKSDLEVASGK